MNGIKYHASLHHTNGRNLKERAMHDFLRDNVDDSLVIGEEGVEKLRSAIKKKAEELNAAYPRQKELTVAQWTSVFGVRDGISFYPTDVSLVKLQRIKNEWGKGGEL